MARTPTCECGTCKVCRARASNQQRRARKRAELDAAPLLSCNGCGVPTRVGRCAACRTLDRQRADRAPAQPVDPKAVSYLSQIRELAGKGAVVGVRGSQIMIDTTTGRRTWPSLDACLADLTAPARA